MSTSGSQPSIGFEHLLRLSDDTGLFEHARGAVPRREHGYCVDDAARGLLVLSREPEPSPVLVGLGGRYLAFLSHAQAADGTSRNRLGFDRHWKDGPTAGDWWGRSLWGLGSAVSGTGPAWLRDAALDRFALGARARSPWRRACAFAVLGAAEVLSVLPDDAAARDLLRDTAPALTRPGPDATWPWPEPRLTYANATLAEATIAAGDALDDDDAIDDGLRLLGWLVDQQTDGDHLSAVPAGGWAPGEPRPGFDQQPIEVAALADACARAFTVTGADRWRVVVARCVGWFLGSNDGGIAMHDPLTGGGYDGLEAGGRNDNRGAESTLAWLLTLQHGRRMALDPDLAGDGLVSPTPACDLVRRTDVHLRPDPARVVAQLFVAGEELSSGGSRASPLMQRVLAMSDEETETVLAATLHGFEDRHPHLEADLLAHFAQVGDRLGTDGVLSPSRRLLLGAYATSEFAVEAAALCNPSMVAHPDQSGLGPGELRFVLSLRAVGEGHISSIEFRTGRVGPGDALVVDDPGPLLVDGTLRPTHHDRARFAALVQEAGTADELVALILDGLPPTFTPPQLEASIAALNPQVLTRRRAGETIDRIRTIARSNYGISFAEDSTLGQRVLRPRSPTEARGMEDARFVRFVDDDASVRFYGTYTAFDGSHIEPQMLMTHDFRTFDVHQLRGRSATNKGMALFPRRIDGRYVALSRWDRERNAVTTSVDGWRWDDSTPIQAPEAPWELIQVGNCGSPIETDEGWLVLTHGVGPMRTYSMGALLLDLEHPERVRGRLASPLLSPEEPEREGYVPNVVYSCGALLHRGTVFLPYAYGDRVTTAATVPLDGLLAALLGP